MTTAAYLALGAVLFAVGAVGAVIRTSAAGRVVGVELMVAAATLTFAASGVGFRELDGQIAALLAILVAAAQAIVGYALVSGVRRPE
ncbi:MAG TPA: NADH-quinone oxidoreductase subunit K [Candidatus Limnocylindria bacterium]